MAPGCSICQEPFGEEDGLECTSTCGHIYHSQCLQQWLEMCPRSEHCPLCRTRCSSSQAVISVYLTHFGQEGLPSAGGGSGAAGDGTAEAKLAQDKVLTLTLEKQRLELLLAASKDAARVNADDREALEAKVTEAENKLRGEVFQRANMLAAHNAAQAELRQRNSFLQTLNQEREKRLAELEAKRDELQAKRDELERRNKMLEDRAAMNTMKESAHITKEELDAICKTVEDGGDMKTVVATLQNSLLERNAQFRELTAKINASGYEKMMADNALKAATERNEKLKDKLRKVLAARCDKCKGSEGNRQQLRQPQQMHQQQQQRAAEGRGVLRRQGEEPEQTGEFSTRADGGTGHGTGDRSRQGRREVDQRGSLENDVVMLGNTLSPSSGDEATLRGDASASGREPRAGPGPDELLSEGLQPWPVQSGHAKKRVRANQQPQGGPSQDGVEPEAGRRKSPEAQDSGRAGASGVPEAAPQEVTVKQSPVGQPGSRGMKDSWDVDMDEDTDRGVRVRPRQDGHRASGPDAHGFGSSPESPFDTDLPLGGGPVTPNLQVPSIPGTMGNDLVLGRSSLGRPSMWGSLGGTLETGTVASVRVSSRSTAHLAVEQAMKQAQRRKEGSAAQAPHNPFTLAPRAQLGAAREPSLGAPRGVPTSSRSTLPRDSFDSEADPFDLATSNWSHDDSPPELPSPGNPGPGYARDVASDSLNRRTGSGGIGSAGVGEVPQRAAETTRPSASSSAPTRGTSHAPTKVKPHARNKQQGVKKAAHNPFKSSASPSIGRFFQRKEA